MERDLSSVVPIRDELATACEWVAAHAVLYDAVGGSGCGDWQRVEWSVRSTRHVCARYADEGAGDFLIRAYRMSQAIERNLGRGLPTEVVMQPEHQTIQVVDIPSRWFAWYPVKLESGVWTWLRQVTRWHTFYTMPARGIAGKVLNGYTDALHR